VRRPSPAHPGPVLLGRLGHRAQPDRIEPCPQACKSLRAANPVGWPQITSNWHERARAEMCVLCAYTYMRITNGHTTPFPIGGMMRTAAAISLGVLALTQPTMAHAETLRWKCNYTSRASPEGLAADKFSMEFVLDTITVKAVIVGNNGMSEVAVVSGNQGTTFQETLRSGAVQTTTIANDASSVHSRHTMLSGKLTPSQYYGTCK
jgi:hypothetical protein